MADQGLLPRGPAGRSEPPNWPPVIKGLSHAWGPKTLPLKPSGSPSHFNRAALLFPVLHVHTLRVLQPRKAFTTWLWDTGPTWPLCSIFQTGFFSPSHPKCATSSTFHIFVVYPTCRASDALEGRYSHNAGATLVTHGQLLGISNRCSHFGDWSLNTSES